MPILRIEHVGIVVDDLAAATACVVELGLELQGPWAVEGVRVEAAMMETPDGFDWGQRCTSSPPVHGRAACTCTTEPKRCSSS